MPDYYQEREGQFYAEDFELPDYPSRIFRRQRGWEQLIGLGEPVSYPKNTIVVEADDSIRWCYLVISGRVISKEYTSEGTEHIFNIFEDGSLFLESNLLLRAPSAVVFQSMEPCELIRIDRPSLVRAMDEKKEISHFVFESISYKYYSAMDQLRQNYDHDAAWKLYNMLLIMADSYGVPRENGWVQIDLKISQQMLSSLLSVNRVTVSKILREMKEMRLIELVNGYYCIRSTRAEQDQHGSIRQ